MTLRRLRLLLAVPLAVLLFGTAAQHGSPSVRDVRAIDLTKIKPALRAHVSGNAQLELGSLNPRAAAAATKLSYFPVGDDGCPAGFGEDVKVNQNCLNVSDATLQGRGQAQNETSIAIDPMDARHVVASYNDYRRGDGTCGLSYSLDAGQNWTDSTVPNGFTLGPPTFGAAREYWQAGGDTSVAWDTKGNAYLSCQVFNRGAGTTPNPDQSSAFVVFRSTRNHGASWDFPARYATVANDVAGSGAILEDKALMTVDDHVGSPFQDRIYVTWTEFTATTGYIYEVHSDDYGQSFSSRQLISTATTLCTFPLTPGAGCDNNQFSQPLTGSDGALYVVWANYNTVNFGVTTPAPAKYQILMVKSTDGGATFGAPEQVGQYYELPDCATYTGGLDFGRACIPEKGATNFSDFRAANYPAGAVNPANPKQVVVSFGSYVNEHSNERNGCVPTGTDPVSTGGLYTGVKTPGACNNDILVSASGDGGQTFTGAGADPRTLTSADQEPGQATTDQWFQWVVFTRNGRLAVTSYDRQYGTDERTGFSDFSVSGSSDLVHFATTRATGSSMPPPTEFGGVFWGDYTGADAAQLVKPAWSDTRSRDIFVCPGTGQPGVPPQLCGIQPAGGPADNDQDILTTSVAAPRG